MSTDPPTLAGDGSVPGGRSVGDASVVREYEVSDEGGIDAALAPTVAGSTPRRRRGAWPGATLRVVVVLVVAGVGYQLVVPVTHSQRGRLARLVVTRSSAPDFPGPPASAMERPSSTGNLTSLQAAAKASPGATGLYVASWGDKASSSDGLAVVAFLLPNAATAGRVRAEIDKTQLAAGAYDSAGLSATGHFSPPGVAGVTGSLYGSKPGTQNAGFVAVAAWQSGNVVALVEGVRAAASPQADTVAAVEAEASHLKSLGSGYTLSVTRRPVTASALWAAATVALAVLAGAGPIGLRRRRERRARERQEELERTIRVGGQTIVRRRRDS